MLMLLIIIKLGRKHHELREPPVLSLHVVPQILLKQLGAKSLASNTTSPKIRGLPSSCFHNLRQKAEGLKYRLVPGKQGASNAWAATGWGRQQAVVV